MLTGATAVGYLRKSVRGRDAMDRSRDNQATAIAALAARDGTTIARVYDKDWGRSGGRGRDNADRVKRSDMAELIGAIRAGSVAAVYAYSIDRLARDQEYGLTLWNACADQDVPIVTDRRRYDTSDSYDRRRFVDEMGDAERDLEEITKRNRDIKARARVNGTSVGGILAYGHDVARHPSEDPQAVVTAYREAGSYNGAANQLNAARIPARRGGLWTPRSVMLVVQREAPDLARRFLSRSGVSPNRTRTFSALLTCHCGAILTAHTRPGRKRKNGTIGPSSNAYICKNGRVNAARHGRPLMVAEPTIIRWATEEAAKLRIPYSAVEVAERTEGNREAARGRLARANDLYIAGKIDRMRYEQEAATVQRELDSLEATRVIVDLPKAIDWTWPPAKLNGVLRSIWRTVKLDEQMQVAEVDWLVPAWRA